MKQLKDYKTKYNPEVFKKILRATPEDLELDLEIVYLDWLYVFFYTIVTREHPDYNNKVDQVYQFIKEKNGSEENFKKWFPDLVYDKYLHPEDIPNPTMKIKKEKIERAAQELKDLGLPGTIDDFRDILRRLYLSSLAVIKNEFCINHFWTDCLSKHKKIAAAIMSDEIFSSLRDSDDEAA